MTALAQEIRERIRRDGPLNIAAYMELCLSHPVHGYYRRSRPIGAAGDFITAPEVSQMFGELIGLWCADGVAGHGPAAACAPRRAGPWPRHADGRCVARREDRAGLPRCHRPSPDRIERDAARRADRGRLGDARPTWYEQFETVPSGPVLVVANEFFDALPIRQFERVGDAWRERVVTLAPPSQALRFAHGDRTCQRGLRPGSRAGRHHRRTGTGAGGVGRESRCADHGRRRCGAHRRLWTRAAR